MQGFEAEYRTNQTNLKHIFSTRLACHLNKNDFTGFPGSYRTNFICKFARVVESHADDFGPKMKQAITLDDNRKLFKCAPTLC